MKDNNLKKQTNLFIAISSCLGIFMVAAFLGSSLGVKPTYSAPDCEDGQCLNITYEYGSTVPEGTKCYGCKTKCTGDDCGTENMTVYVYETSASAAKSAMRATGTCEVAADEHCLNVCEEGCYECDVNGGKAYAYAVGHLNAESLTSGSNCKITSIEKCSNPSKPVTTNCYECNKNGIKNYLYSTSSEQASQISGGTGCLVTTANHCETVINENPTTGTTAIIIAWIVGILALSYSVWYFLRTKSL